LIFHMCKEDKPIIYMKDSEIGPVTQTCPIPQASPIILWRQISTWESKNKPDSKTILSFHVMHVYNSVRVSVLLLCYKAIDWSEWKVEYLGKTKSCTNRVGVSVRIRVRFRVKVWVSVKYYVIKVVTESFRIRVFPLNGPMSVEHIRGHLWHRYSGQPSRGCDRNTFEVMTNFHPPNRFAHKERIRYDYICPNKKEEKTQRTSRHDILKGE
jgi:hypothetical protein